MKVNIIILNYNGRKILEECLPSICEAQKNSKNSCTLTVLDNLSTDTSLEYIGNNFAKVKIVLAQENLFLCSYNDFIRQLNDDIVILLNNDIKLDKDFVDPLVEIFEKYPDAFIATPKCWTFGSDNITLEGGATKIAIKYGMFRADIRYKEYLLHQDTPGYTASGGSVVAFRRDRFLELGGYDNLYLPGRLEDVDICYRGYKRGWKGYYEPKSLSYHKGFESFHKSFGKNKTLTIAYRNTFLFMWKNIIDTSLTTKHILFLIPRLAHALLTLNFCFIKGFFLALGRLPKTLAKRKLEKNNKRNILSDNDIFNIVGTASWEKT